MSHSEGKAVARVRPIQTETGPAVEIAVPFRTNLEKVLVSEELIRVVRGFVGPGCETCTSGTPITLRGYQDVVNVEFE
jgi:hypothetical protein